MIGVYAIIDQTNGKHYVGQSVRVARRKVRHFHDLRAGTHQNSKLQRAFSKRPDAFTHVVLCTLTDPGFLTCMEQEWMDKLDAFANGYNLSPSAGSCAGTTKPESFKRMQSLRMRARTPEQMAAQAAKNRERTGTQATDGHRANLRSAWTPERKARAAEKAREQRATESVEQRAARKAGHRRWAASPEGRDATAAAQRKRDEVSRAESARKYRETMALKTPEQKAERAAKFLAAMDAKGPEALAARTDSANAKRRAIWAAKTPEEREAISATLRAAAARRREAKALLH